MRPDDLVSLHPRLFHMAHAAAWPSIQRHGLLSTTSLLDLFGVTGDERHEIELVRRPRSVSLEHPVHGAAVIRDQRPLQVGRLQSCLEGMSVDEYLVLLNDRVFFWSTRQRLQRLLNAGLYRHEPQIVLELDTQLLLERHLHEITLSHLNSGATAWVPPTRGRGTFKRIQDFDFEAIRGSRARKDVVVEVAVDYSVPDILDVLLRVERRHPGGDLDTVLWQC